MISHNGRRNLIVPTPDYVYRAFDYALCCNQSIYFQSNIIWLNFKDEKTWIYVIYERIQTVLSRIASQQNGLNPARVSF